MHKNEDLELFENQYQADVLGGINQAVGEGTTPFGYYANQLHQRFYEVEQYLQSSYTKANGTKLGSTGRRAAICAFLKGEESKFKMLVE